jgi:hypothetical protein
MLIRDWDIWHTYSSFLNVGHIDLMQLGEALVESGVVPCVLHRDGRTWWRTGQGTRRGSTHVELNPRRIGAKITLEVDGGGETGLEGYAAEAWYQASHFRFNELRLCMEGPLPPPYIRAVLGEFHLNSSEEGFGVILYPIVKIFDSGVILVQFRTIAPDRDIPIDEFIRRHVNLGLIPFDEVEVPPEVTDLAARAYYHSVIKWPLHLRLFLNKVERQHRRAVAEKTKEIRSGDFIAWLTPLPREGGHGDTLASLAQMIFSIVGFVGSDPRSGVSFLLLGQRRIILPGNYWCGRPHIYLLDFEGQKSSATENVKTFSREFGWIHGRHPGGSSEQGLRYLPEDMRHFDDYSTFLSQTASLWVWSNAGKERQEEWADLNRGHLIYEQQATIELFEYGYMLHRALHARVEEAESSAQIHELRWALNHLQSSIADATHFGETRELLHAGWEKAGVSDLKARIVEGLSIRSDQTAVRDARESERIGRWLIIVFGVVAVPPIANEVLSPLWVLLGWWQPELESAASLFFIAIAITLVAAVVASVSVWSKKASNRKYP